ncbi:unnamed protein product [Brugia timori]|uniref:KID domain-containing protein n=1 Tax=Brugia timori TaxID=42155 RepID=A0A0R3R6B6_9BILA|nr:unnamed protein product [Brugia timori]
MVVSLLNIARFACLLLSKHLDMLNFQLKVLAKVILQNQSNDEIISDDEARRRREQLNRRPSYRLIN